MLAAAARCSPARAILLAVVSANAAGRAWGRAAPVQHGEEHPADDRGDEGELGEAGERDLAVYGQRDPGGPQGNRTSGRDRGGQDTDPDRGARQRASQSGRAAPGSCIEGGGNDGHGWFLSLAAVLCTPLAMSTNGEGGFDTEG
jgi:hypothetical protein